MIFLKKKNSYYSGDINTAWKPFYHISI